MFGKSNEDTYRARHKVEVSPKCTKLGVKSAMFGSLFALGIPAGSAKAVENPANVLTAESVNAVAASLENGFTVSPANQPRKRGRRAAAPAKLPDPDGGFPPSRKEQIKNENTRFVDVDLYELEWDENITLNGVPVGKVSGRETDPGFMKLSDGKYVYYYDFNTASTLDMGEILKRIKAVPKDKEKSKKLPTYYGRDYFRAKIVVKDFPYKGEGLLWSGAEEIQNHNGEPIDVVYYSKSGYTNYKENLVGTNYERFNSIEKKIVGDKVFNEVSGAKYEGEIVIRHHTMIYQFKDIAKNYSITIQGVDLRAPVVDLANTGKTLGLSSGVHIATADSLDTQFNNSKIDVSDNVTPKNKLQSQAKFSFVDPQNPHKELTLQEVQDAAKKGGFPKHYDVKVAVTDDAGFTAKANDNSAVKLAGTLIVAPAIKLPKETEKVVVLDSASLTPGDKARIIDAVKKANPQNTLLTFPSTKITVDPNNITITYPDGGNSVKVPVKKFIGEIRQTETSSGDAKFMDAVGVETGGRAELVLSGATDVDAVGVETGGRAELVLSGATDVDAVGVETGGRAELVLSGATDVDAVGVETGGRAELVLSGATDVDAVGVETGGRAELVLSGATDVDAVGVETGGRAELVLSGATDVDAVGVETGGRAELVLSGATDVDAVGVETGGRAELVLSGATDVDAVGVETGGRAELVLSGATDVDAVGVETGGRAELVLSGATDVDAVGVETGGRAELVDKPDALVLADESGSSVVAEKLPQTGADQRDGLFGAAALGLAGLFSVFGARKRREEQ